MDIRFVHPAQLGQSLVGFFPLSLDARCRQGGSQGCQLLRGQTVRFPLVRSGPEDDRKIDHGVAGHGEGELGLASGKPLPHRP